MRLCTFNDHHGLDWCRRWQTALAGPFENRRNFEVIAPTPDGLGRMTQPFSRAAHPFSVRKQTYDRFERGVHKETAFRSGGGSGMCGPASKHSSLGMRLEQRRPL